MGEVRTQEKKGFTPGQKHTGMKPKVHSLAMLWRKKGQDLKPAWMNGAPRATEQKAPYPPANTDSF